MEGLGQQQPEGTVDHVVGAHDPLHAGVRPEVQVNPAAEGALPFRR